MNTTKSLRSFVPLLTRLSLAVFGLTPLPAGAARAQSARPARIQSTIRQQALTRLVGVRIDSTAVAANLILSARRQVLLVTPILRSRMIAEALRKKAVAMGLPIYIMTSDQVAQNDSYLPALSLLSSIRIRILPNLGAQSHGLLVVDNRTYIIGPILIEYDHTSAAFRDVGSYRNTLVDNPAITRYVQQIIGYWPQAASYHYAPPPHS